MNYAVFVTSFAHIKTLMASVALLLASATASFAADLTPEEQDICPKLRVCVDILRRHDASEFDYQVLGAQFEKFGPQGRAALFEIINSAEGNADIAALIARSGPLSPIERARVNNKWSIERAGAYLPLFLDGHPLSRDQLLLTLGSEQLEVREQARLGLAKLPQTLRRQAVSQELAKPLISALLRDPVAEAAPYLARLNVRGQEQAFAALLRSGEPEIIAAAYEALYRNDQLKAFNTLLSEMGKVSRPKQARAIGDMLLRRHQNRSDGFYLNFARDISGDKTRPLSTRAIGLHAVMVGGEGGKLESTQGRTQALEFLVRTQPLVTENSYLPFLKKTKSTGELGLIWKIANAEKWVNRDRVSDYFEDTPLKDQVTVDLLGSDDVRSFLAGLKHAKPVHEKIIQSKINHPNVKIGNLARRALKIPILEKAIRTCLISNFDAKDWANQMPFFDSAWTQSSNGTRSSLTRKFLTAAHPSKTGWLAGYDLQKKNQTPIHQTPIQTAGTLVHFDNKTGAFDSIGNFPRPVAILPDRFLRLGESTNRFWVIAGSGETASQISAYAVELLSGAARITHLGVLPDSARNFTVAPNGDLLMRFDSKAQAPLRMSRRGDLSFACRPAKPVNGAPAPN